MKKSKGFTLIETVIIVAIVAIVASIAAPSFVGSIDRTKARKTSDFVYQLVTYAKSEALNKNTDVYLTLVSNSICLSYTQKDVAGHTCDVRSDTIQTGTTIEMQDSITSTSIAELKFEKVYGLPDAIVNPVLLKITSNESIKSVTIDILGFVKVS